MNHSPYGMLRQTFQLLQLLGNDDESQRPENVPMQKITPSEVDRHKIALVFVGKFSSFTLFLKISSIIAGESK